MRVAADFRAGLSERESKNSVVDSQANEMGGRGVGDNFSSLLQVWRKMEMSREKTWNEPSRWQTARLRRRAFLVAKLLPVFPGRAVLELGAGSGAWTEHLASVFGGQNPITAAVFNKDLEHIARSKKIPNSSFICIEDLQSAFPVESFDYVVGTDILPFDLCPATLEAVYKWLKPGGQFLFFALNTSNPLAWFRKVLNRSSRVDQSTDLQKAIALRAWSDAAGRTGFDNIEIMRCEVIAPFQSAAGQAIGLILEQAPVARQFSSIVSLRGAKPGSASDECAPQMSLATHPNLFGTVSVVVPCHNEEANINRLVKMLLGLYGDYIHEIVIVDDNSVDRTAEVAAALAGAEPRVKLVKRKPPAGVGRALRDGYAAATGKYILTIDCDFINIAPEFKGLFDAVAEGCDGAIGSRFSSESALVRYPFFKIVCNRGYHLLLNLLLRKRVRDVSNNLKLYRAGILKNLDIEEDHFAANVETGLKPLLLNYRIREVPTSWINRTANMGKSSFRLLKVGPDYLRVLLRTTWRTWRGQYRISC
jgi:dolichol-phosphate mannosyltransferase